MMEKPNEQLLLMLASMVIHIQEHEATGEGIDLVTARSIANNPDINRWVESIDAVLLPVKR